MKGNFQQRREARQDLIEIFRHIARQTGLRTARRFLAQADATFQRLASLPNIGTAFEPGEPRFAGLRYCPVSRFKTFIIFYRPMPDGIEVLRVLHGSRNLEAILTTDMDTEADDGEAPEGG
jgi:toxin ParE1/3/4